MDGIYCGYYDEELDQDVPVQPTLDEALLLFNKFHWKNESKESAMKALMFQIPDEAFMIITNLEKNMWHVSASVSNRRRFLGPYFKKKTFRIFLDTNAIDTEELLRLFYKSTLSEFTDLLKNNPSL
jgi:hypothetical protein